MKRNLKKFLAVSLAAITLLGCSLTASAKFAGNSTFTFIDGTKIGYSISEKSTHKINMSDLDIVYDKNGAGLYTHTYAITNTFKNQRTVGNKILYINNDTKSTGVDKALQTLRINAYLDTIDYPLIAQMINKEGDIVVSIGDKSMVHYLASVDNYTISKNTDSFKENMYKVDVTINVNDFHVIMGNTSIKLGNYNGYVTDLSYNGATSVYDDDSTIIKVSFNNVSLDELKKGLKLSWFGQTMKTIKK